MFIMLYLFVRHVATLKQYWAIICALKIREKKKKAVPTTIIQFKEIMVYRKPKLLQAIIA